MDGVDAESVDSIAGETTDRREKVDSVSVVSGFKDFVEISVEIALSILEVKGSGVDRFPIVDEITSPFPSDSVPSGELKRVPWFVIGTSEEVEIIPSVEVEEIEILLFVLFWFSRSTAFDVDVFPFISKNSGDVEALCGSPFFFVPSGVVTDKNVVLLSAVLSPTTDVSIGFVNDGAEEEEDVGIPGVEARFGDGTAITGNVFSESKLAICGSVSFVGIPSVNNCLSKFPKVVFFAT